jgi:hypothetical protein
VFLKKIGFWVVDVWGMSFEKSGVLEFFVVVGWSMGGRWMVDPQNIVGSKKKVGIAGYLFFDRSILKNHNFWIEGSIDGFFSIDGF